MTELWATFRDLWPAVVPLLHAVTALAASSHAIMTKDEPRAAIGWVGLIWLSPFLGAFLYYVLGINRIRRKAIAIKGEGPDGPAAALGSARLLAADRVLGALAPLARAGDAAIGVPLLPGNAIEPLVDGEEAYPAMLAAIDGARRSVMLGTYIFDNDAAGREFVAALGRAVRRGVEVRVLIDATGARYSFPSILRPLQAEGVRAALFLPNFRLTKIAFFNLRSHRKILVVDGRIGFTGGMNIREGHYVRRPTGHAVQDLQFLVAGPVVAHLAQAFVEDWAFTTGEVLSGDAWLPPLEAAGDVLARGVKDGPDKDFEKLLWVLYAATRSARESIRIVTPYFLPDPTTIRMLGVAALSGVRVDVVIPERNNIPFVHWAAMATLPALLDRGVRVHLARPPFDHSKLVVVDDAWVFFGSANWDTRSLRLNFELNVECVSRGLAAAMIRLFEAKRAKARPLTLDELKARSLPVKLRDGLFRLGTPYL